MILTGDYHTHTVYSHGKGTVLENAKRAEEIGLKEIGISDHGFSHPAFGLSHRKLPKIYADVKRANEETGVKVLLGIEANLRGVSGKTDLNEKDYEYFDIFLCGAHKFIWFDKLGDWFNFFGRNILCTAFNKKPSEKLVKLTTKAYVNAIKNNPIDVITHLNFWVHADAVEVAKVARDYGTYIEINSKKIHLESEVLQKVADTGVKFVINSDAHVLNRIGETTLAEEVIKEAGINLNLIDNIGGKLPKFRFNEFKIKHGIEKK